MTHFGFESFLLWLEASSMIFHPKSRIKVQPPESNRKPSNLNIRPLKPSHPKPLNSVTIGFKIGKGNLTGYRSESKSGGPEGILGFSGIPYGTLAPPTAASSQPFLFVRLRDIAIRALAAGSPKNTVARRIANQLPVYTP